VILGLENHDYLTRIDRMLPIIKAIDSPWFGVNLDSGNVDTTDVFPELAEDRALRGQRAAEGGDGTPASRRCRPTSRGSSAC
jgi:hypothetical protein